MVSYLFLFLIVSYLFFFYRNESVAVNNMEQLKNKISCEKNAWSSHDEFSEENVIETSVPVWTKSKITSFATEKYVSLSQ